MFKRYVMRMTSGLVASSLVVPWVQAQAGGDSADQQLAEIVVTAQRRTENLQNVPIAVTALSSEELKSSGVNSTLDLPLLTPGLIAPQSAGNVTPHIRGVGTSAFGAGLENSVATYVDGVYIANAPSSVMQLDNVSEVEVLKGPQGTLFGRNATGGLIQITTKDPQTAVSGHLEAGYANYQTSKAVGYITGGPSDTVAADLSVAAQFQRQGWGRNDFNGEDVYQDDRNLAFRNKWLIRPLDGTTIHVNFDYSADDGNQFQSSHSAPGTKPAFGAAFNGSPWDIDNDFQPYDSYSGGGASVRLDQDLGSLTLVDIVAYRKSSFTLGFDADLTPLPLETINPLKERDSQLTEELRLMSSTSESRVKWVVGAYFFRGDGGYYPSQVELGGPVAIPLGPPPAPSIDAIRISGIQKTNSLAGYGQATTEVADKTNLTLGARYTTERHELDANEFGFITGGIPIGTLIPPVSEHERFSAPTWRLALDHKFADDVLAYVSYNRGFKSGGYNVGVPTDAAFQPEKLDAFEVGTKVDLLNRHLRVDSAAYYYNYSNIQVSHYVLGQIGYYNGAKARLYGLDTDLEAQITSNFHARVGIALNHSEFTSFPDAVIFTQLPTGGAAVSTGSAEGNTLPFAPRGGADASLNYRIPMPTGAVDLNVTDAFSTSWYASVDNVLRQPAYNLLNAGVRWTAPGERYFVDFWGRNLTDEAVASTINASALGSLIQYQPPRTYGVTVTVDF